MAPNDPNTNPNQDIANPSPVDSTEPNLDMDAINAAVVATADEASNNQGAYNVEDINLDNTPTSDAELQQQLSSNPNMNLAGDNPTSDAVNIQESANISDDTQSSVAPDLAPTATDATTAAPAKPTESAGFVDGDLSNETSTPSNETTPNSEAPAVAANVVTAPGAKKSNKNLFIILGAVAALALVVVAIVLIVSLL